MVELFVCMLACLRVCMVWTDGDFRSTIKFNTSTGEEYCECFAYGTDVAIDIIKAALSLASHLPLFSPETGKQQSAVYSK